MKTMNKIIPARDLSDAEVDAELARVKLERERLALEKDKLLQMERERALCTISTALKAFNGFLLEFKDYLLAIPEEVMKIIPSVTPDQYERLKESVDNQIRRLHEKTITLTLTDTRTEAEQATDIAREGRRAANRKAGRTKDDNGV